MIRHSNSAGDLVDRKRSAGWLLALAAAVAPLGAVASASAAGDAASEKSGPASAPPGGKAGRGNGDPAHGASASGDRPRPARKPADIAATVNGEAIYRQEVDRGAERVLAGRSVSSENLAAIKAEVLAQLIDRLSVEQLVKRSGMTVSDGQLDLVEKQIRMQLEQQKVSFDSFLSEQRQTESEFRDRLAWQTLWGKYAQSKLNDAAYQAYFNAHATDFDGTELRVSHVLLRPAKSGDPDAVKKLLVEAAELRERIQSGQLPFDEAARRYSAGPSREQGGDLGFIPRHGPMEEAFALAAFQLQPNEISKPVATHFGVHLIKVTAVRPGAKRWTDVREQIKGPLALALFSALAEQQREKADIHFAPGVPHFKPGTRDLAPGG